MVLFEMINKPAFMKISSLITVVVLLIMSPVSAAVIEGIVLSEKGPVDISSVYAHKSFSDIEKEMPAYKSDPGDKKGFFKLVLPPGTYYLTASGKSEETDYFAFHGANPIVVEDSDLWIPLMVLPRTTSEIRDASSSRLAGTVTFKGGPVRNAQVSIYPLTDIAFRGMGFLTSTTNENGYFSLNAEPDRYVIIARQRKNFSGLRPLKKGDLFCYFDSNPVTVSNSRETNIEIPCYPKDDLQAFLNEDVYPAMLVKKSNPDSVRLRENKISKTANVSMVKGRVTDLNGFPMKNLYVMAYQGRMSQMFQMLDVRTMPEYLVKTDDQGYYTIEAEKKGAYYMVARELIGEAPAKGENYGLFEGNTNHAVVVEDESINDADIVVSRVMDEDRTQNTEHGTQRVVRGYEYDGDTVIHEDTVWADDIIINGVVHVARSATLTIRPGTVVKFRRIDNNRDGVGDGKIRVSGKLVAVGTPQRQILFTSAEEKPRKMDWSYVLFFVSGSENVVKHCIFTYAFTGVQVHFSRAVVSDSFFTGNHEAVRFGRTELRIEHNDIISNSFGIRYTRMEGPVEITSNNIWNNGIGIFHVPSNQNIVDFSGTFDKKAELHRYQPVVKYNNIAYNEEYNFRLGERQGYNILLNDNWWGSVDDRVIHETIYDERMDGTLGRVISKPYMTSPVKDAGVRGR